MQKSLAYVPVVAERLHAARRVARIMWAELARRLDTDHQRLKPLYTGKGGTCRPQFRKALARELGVTPEWLGGEVDQLPYARSPVEWDLKGGEITFVYPDEMPAKALSAVHVAEHRLGQRCHDALMRDLAARYGTRERAERAYWDDSWWMVVETVLQLVHPSRWQRRLFPKRSGLAPLRPGRVAARTGEAALALAAGFEITLEPWFNGEADLDLRMLVWIATAQGNHLPKRKKR